MRFDPQSTLFAILSFEGPDVYSQAGGLGVRAKELSRALAQLGFETHLFFVGDPEGAAEEQLVEGRLTLHRWSQWLSAGYRGGVYEGEQEKIHDWNLSLPRYLVEKVLAPAIERGLKTVVLGEEWQTARSMNLVSDILYYRGLRHRAVMLWNANNLFGFDRIDWAALQFVTTLTTVSRYMKHRMWELALNPIVIPNGIPPDAVVEVPAATRQALKKAAGSDLLLFKIGRFDPGKGWTTAMTAVGLLKRAGISTRLLIRGGREAHGADVLAHAADHGLVVEDVVSPRDAEGLAAVIRSHPKADVLNLVTFLPDALVRAIYPSVDAVLANSAHEPFGLVGLEVMAGGGLAVTGSTGEDYAEPYRNALVMETQDPRELVAGLRLVKEQPGLSEQLRQRGRATALDFLWDRVIEQLLHRLELAASRQGVALESDGALKPSLARRRKGGRAGVC